MSLYFQVMDAGQVIFKSDGACYGENLDLNLKNQSRQVEFSSPIRCLFFVKSFVLYFLGGRRSDVLRKALSGTATTILFCIKSCLKYFRVLIFLSIHPYFEIWFSEKAENQSKQKKRDVEIQRDVHCRFKM